MGELSQLVPELKTRYGEAEVHRQLGALDELGGAVDDPELWLRTALARQFKFMPIERVEHCPCGGGDSTPLSRFVYWNLLGTRRCDRCGLVFVSPRLTQKAVRRVFEAHYFNSSDPEFWGTRRVSVFRDIMRLIERYGCRRVFDVGAAYGHFVSWLRARGIAAEGCEISGPAVAWGRENRCASLHHGAIGHLDLAGASYKCVVSLDTFYYIADPVAELHAMRRILAPGGVLILRLRNNSGAEWRARRAGRKMIGEPPLPMPHLWAFTPRTIEPILRRCGLEVLVSEPAAYSRTPLRAAHAVLLHANRAARHVYPRVPMLTRSFNVVARRAD